ncbi:hypothetical protein E8E95_25200 [Pseudomonas sp. BN414]|nr:hypothetical protein [Pseudomonas sp. BN414]
MREAQPAASLGKPRVGYAPRYTSGCEADHWINSVEGNGEVVTLEDGSVWLVDDVDTVDSSLWLPTTDIVACDGKLINIDDDESVWAERIR